MLEISRKYTYLPEVVVSSAGSSTTRAARHKMAKKNRSRIYDLGVVPTRGKKSSTSGLGLIAFGLRLLLAGYCNCRAITTQYFIAYNGFTTTIDYWLQRAERLSFVGLPWKVEA